MKFAQPHWLWILFVWLPVGLWLGFWSLRKSRELLSHFIAPRLQPVLVSSVDYSKKHARMLLILLGTALIIIALARPQFGYTWEKVERKGTDVLIAIDTSRSMLTQDVKPNRLDRSKLAVQDLLKKLQGDRVGLIAFAGTAFLQVPMTVDYDAFRLGLDSIKVGVIPKGGTDIGSAIELAEKTFGNTRNNYKVLILITDGEDLEDTSIEAARKAAENSGLMVFTVGVGSAQGDLIPLTIESGGTEFLKNEKGEVVKSRLDEDRLSQVAELTKGFYVPLSHKGNGLVTVYENGLAMLPKQQIDSQLLQNFIERFQWPLGLAIFCLMIELLVSDRKSMKEVKP